MVFLSPQEEITQGGYSAGTYRLSTSFARPQLHYETGAVHLEVHAEFQALCLLTWLKHYFSY